ncbi:MAG TPA: HAD-IIB family hydrolase, partial [Usitatibacteraceae bacterium]|nr:HAD-IIB family hydrolase [Usitatibacteraceae bacterium]
ARGVPLKPLSAIDPSALRTVRGILFDIDDTLTTHGRLTAEAYAAMERAGRAGLTMIPISGRPAGWCDHIARMWPVDGVVGENGAFYFWFDTAARKLMRRFVKDEAARQADRERLDGIARQILAAVPGAALASDQPYREADIAIDFCEDVAPLDDAAIDTIRTMMQAAGLNAKVSSIHVNGWLGDYDKRSTTRLFFRERYAIDLDADRDEFLFIGDSPNDAPMFGYFPLSVGVANVRTMLPRLALAPAYVTEHASGAGFAEAVGRVLAVRR